MAEEPEEPVLAGDFERQLARTRVRSPNHVVAYSNFAQIGMTGWDIRIEFSLLGEFEPNKAGVTDLATIILTPALAKALVGVLNSNVKAYEQDNGEIKMPASIVREVQNRAQQAATTRAESGTIPAADARAEAVSEVPKVEPTAAPKK